MKLIDAKTGTPIQQGDTVELRDDRFIVSHIDYGARRIFLIDLEADKSPFPIPAVSIGAKFAA